MKEITLRSLIDIVTTCSSAGKRYCFILGAGASKTSGIKTGVEMAKEWLKEMETNEPNDYHEWIEKNEIAKSDPGLYYSKIYGQRFRNEHTCGFIRLQNEMEKAIPSPGYYYLAEILNGTQNKLVITTNFDSLTEDSLFIYNNKNALVITHESLAKYIDALSNRPTVIKLHRDLLLQPKSGEVDVSTLSEEWENSLQKIMDIYVPIVIGYGGNDGSLMGFLKSIASKDKTIYWCYRRDNPVNERIKKLLEEYRGFIIPIEDFDNTMYLFGDRFGYNFSDKTIQEITSERAEKLIDKYNEWMNNRKKSLKTMEKLNDTESMVFDSFKTLSERNIFEFENLSLNDPKNAINYNKIGDDYYFQQDYNKAVDYYTKAIELEPDNAEYYFNRGLSCHRLKEYEKAIADKSKAIELEPDNAQYYFSRGVSYDWLKEYEKAIADFSEAIKLDPNNAKYYRSLVRVLCRTNDFVNAQINLNKIISLDDKSAIYYNTRGYIGIKKAKHDKVKCEADVLDDLNKAIELNNDASFTEVFYIDRAEYYLYSNDPDNAYNDLQKSVGLYNMEGRTYFFMARYYEIKGNTQECERCMDKMKECRYTPDNSDY